MNTEMFPDAGYKDESPLKTVEKIKGILKENGIETTESWIESGVPYCYSIRISVVGTTFGTTGKGLSKEFALASGYGELMERLQLGHIGRKDVQKDGIITVNDSQNETVSAEALAKRNRRWYKAYAERLFMFTGEHIDENSIQPRFEDGEGNVVCTPYYCLTTDSKEHLPLGLRKSIYTANGCAAGNTMEEALVQAISEVVERHHLIKMSAENLSLPDIPDSKLEECKYAYKIITYLREKGYKVTVKDCSFGERFPVVCTCIINTKNGRYHTHFGANPVFEIALERTLTEIFQGKNINTIAKFEELAYVKGKNIDIKNLRQEITFGAAEKTFDFFAGEPSFPYNPNIGIQGENNKILLKECVKYFKEKGYDILVRDASCLGFPTYQVIIPGYSETTLFRLSPRHKENQFSSMAAKVLRNPSLATVDELLAFLLNFSENRSADFTMQANLPLDLSHDENTFMLVAALAYAQYSLGRYSEMGKYINRMLKVTDENDVDRQNRLISLKRYFILLEAGKSASEIKRTLLCFHSPESVEELFGYVDSGKNPFEVFTLRCDWNCSECHTAEKCCKRRYHELAQLINTKTKELDFEKFKKSVRTYI